MSEVVLSYNGHPLVDPSTGFAFTLGEGQNKTVEPLEQVQEILPDSGKILQKVTVNKAIFAVPIEVDTPEGMTAALIPANEGKVFVYTGTPTPDYAQGFLYVVEPNEDVVNTE